MQLSSEDYTIMYLALPGEKKIPNNHVQGASKLI